MVDDEERNAIERTLQDLAPPDRGEENSYGKAPKPKTNHTVRVLNAFNVDKCRMVHVSITFKPNPNFPGRENTSYDAIIPMHSIESSGCHAVDEIREKLFNQTPFQLFVSSRQKYCRDLMGLLYRFDEKERRDVDATNKTVLSFNLPTPFDDKGICYLAAGDIWRITAPVKKLTAQERNELSVMIDYTGERVDFEENEKEVVKTIISLISRFTAMQVDPTNNGFPLAYLSRSVQNGLYRVLVPRYKQPVTYCASLKNEKGKALTGIGKTTMCNIAQLLLTNSEKRGGGFSEPHISEKVKKGEQCIVDELHLNRRDTKPGLTTVICAQFQQLERMIGQGGSPKAAVIFHSNKAPSELKLRNEVRERVIWIYPGIIPLRPNGILQMFDDAQAIYKYLPTTLSMGVNAFYNRIPDEIVLERMDALGEMSYLVQEFYNLERFHNLLQTLAYKHGIEIPDWLSRDVDFRPYLHPDPGDDDGPKSLEDFLSAVESAGMEGDCAMIRFKRKEGIRIWSSAFQKPSCPDWVKAFAYQLPGSASYSRRFRFAETQDVVVQHPLIDKLKDGASNEDSSDDEIPRPKSSRTRKRQLKDSSDDEDFQDKSPRAQKKRSGARKRPLEDSSDDEDFQDKSPGAQKKRSVDSNDNETSKRSSKAQSSKTVPGNYRNPDFMVKHDKIILTCIVKSGNEKEVMNDSFWKRLKSSATGQQLLPDHSWDCIRNRFHTEIAPQLDRFEGISEEQKRSIREAMGIVSPGEEIVNSESEFLEENLTPFRDAERKRRVEGTVSENPISQNGEAILLSLHSQDKTVPIAMRRDDESNAGKDDTISASPVGCNDEVNTVTGTSESVVVESNFLEKSIQDELCSNNSRDIVESDGGAAASSDTEDVDSDVLEMDFPARGTPVEYQPINIREVLGDGMEAPVQPAVIAVHVESETGKKEKNKEAGPGVSNEDGNPKTNVQNDGVICTICGKSFPTKRSLGPHSRVHRKNVEKV